MGKNNKIALALSGGIDSSVAGYLLQQKGYDLTGAYLHLEDVKEGIPNAQKAAHFLGIPLEILDLRREFRTQIITPFIDAYISGKTPNPCIVCNVKIKCGILLDWATNNGFSFLATGHYAQIKRGQERETHFLLRGVDQKKDQSYFLYRLAQGQLNKLIFPLGSWMKKEVIDLAKKIGLSFDIFHESQEICFLPSNDYRQFLGNSAPHSFPSGPIFDLAGNRLGTHNGLPYYTIGQRKGLHLIHQGPYYVVQLNQMTNSIIVGRDKDLWQSELFASSLNKIAPLWPKRIVAQIRSTQPAQEAEIEEMGDNRARVHFMTPIRAIAPGQSVVFYEQDVCLGGGVIE